MPKQCSICGKKTVIGRQISHAHNVSAKTRRPNLRRVRAVVDGSVRRILVCARCLRSGKVHKPEPRTWSPAGADEAES